MNAKWTALAARIDALSIRERAFLFFSVVAICVALVDTIWISPARTVHKQLSQQFAAESLELGRLRETLKAKVEQPDAASVVRQEIGRVRAAMATVDAELAATVGAGGAGLGLRELMVHFLRSHNALSLVRTGNVGAESPSGATGKPAVLVLPGLERQSLELTVAGPYPALVKYVGTLETAMPQLRWGQMKLSAEQQPPQLSLQVFVMRPVP